MNQNATSLAELFDTQYKMTQEEANRSDLIALGTLESADRVMRVLSKGPKTFYELNATGLAQQQIAKAIHYLHSELVPPFIGKSNTNDTKTGKKMETRYYLTEAGKINCPDNLTHYGLAETTTTNTAHTSGTRLVGKSLLGKAFNKLKPGETMHIDGLVGKVTKGRDGLPKFQGRNGSVFDYIKNHQPVTIKDLSTGLGISDYYCRTACEELLQIKAIEHKKQGKTRWYSVPNATIIEPAPETPAPAAFSAPDPAPAPPAAQPPEPDTDADVTTIVRRLLKNGHDAADIVLTVLSEQEQELQELRQLKTLIQSINKP